MHLNFHPLLLILIAAVLVGIVLPVSAFFARGAMKKAALIVLGCLLLLPASYMLLYVFVPEAVDGRFRAYKAFYRDIHPGMTRSEVVGLMDHHYPASGTRMRPKITEDSRERLGFFMNPETTKEPNCEGIFLNLAGDRVTSKSYSAD